LLKIAYVCNRLKLLIKEVKNAHVLALAAFHL
jgi:hypothetical protein